MNKKACEKKGSRAAGAGFRRTGAHEGDIRVPERGGAAISRGAGMGNPIVSFYKQLPEEQKRLVSDYLAVIKKIARVCLGCRFKAYEDVPGRRFVYLTPDDPDTGFIECFYPDATVVRTGTVYIWSLMKYTRRYERAMIDLHPLFAPLFPEGTITVRWVRQVTDLATIDTLFKRKSRKEEIRKTKRFALDFSTDPEDLDLFYEKIYLPYTRRWEEDAIILKKSELLRDFGKNGDLALLKSGTEIAGGQFSCQNGDTYTLLVYGLSDESRVREGASAALYYYCVRRAQQKGAAFLDLGLARPFITDGILKYKRKWGGQIRRDPELRRIMYLKNIRKDGLITLDRGNLVVPDLPGTGTCSDPGPYAGPEGKTLRENGAGTIRDLLVLIILNIFLMGSRDLLAGAPLPFF